MVLGYAKNPAADNFPPKAAKSNPADEGPSLQFVTTTGTLAIDESSKRKIRKHASRYVYREKPSSGTAAPKSTRKPPNAAAGGQIHRFRLGPQGLKHTPNQPPQVSQNFTILSLKSDDPPSKSALEAPASVGGVPCVGQEARQSKGNVFEEGDEDEPGEEVFAGTTSDQSRDFSGKQKLVQLVGWAKEEQPAWLDPQLYSRGTSIFEPSSGLMDPFNAMSLDITRREQILLRHYCRPS